MNKHLSRRAFLQSSAMTGAAVFAVSMTPKVFAEEAQPAGAPLPPLLRLGKDGRAILMVPTPDMGQGTHTMAAQLIADELDIDLDDIRVELLEFVGTFENGRAKMGPLLQGAGGSLSTAELWLPLRRTAAYIRGLLIAAAAKRWNTDAAGLTTKAGEVVRLGDRLPYATLVPDIATAAPPANWDSIAVRARPQQTLIGKSMPNKVAPDIVTGKPIFGIDQDIPGMLHAVIRRCPHLKGEVKSFDAAPILAMPGVRAVLPLPRLPEDITATRLIAASVAIVADSLWQAKKAAAALEVEWDGSYGQETDSTLVKARLLEALDSAEMETVVKEGDVDAAFKAAAKTVDATYYHPNWAHTNMEVHSCIADVRADSAEIWLGHQYMDDALDGAARASGVPVEKVKAHFYRMGTGFGRKFKTDYATEACILSKQMQKPVKVTWTREDEMEQDFFNPTGAYRLKGALDADGKLTAIHVRSVADEWPGHASRELPCDLIPSYFGECLHMKTAISTGAWRGPGSNTRAWVTQGFLNEIAHAAGRDPLDLLLELFSSRQTVKMRNWPNIDLDLSRHLAVLRKVEQASGYRTPAAPGRGRGVAIFHTHHSLCAHVVEVEMKGAHDFRVVKVTSAIDCGLPVNPLGIRAQVESGIIDGLCAAKYGKMVFDKGVPVTNNFDSYRKLRMDEAPREIEVHIMDHGDTAPRGTGETSLPPFIPALTNAIFAASGKRIHSLPISENL